MSSDVSAKFTLSIWRDFIPERRLIHSPEGEFKQVVDPETGLQEQLYSWSLQEDIFGGISDDDARNRLHELLFERLSISKSPSDRRIDVLKAFIDASQTLIDNDEVNPVQSGSRTDEDFESNYHEPIEVNSLLALIIHLRWIIKCFGGRPGISITVR